MKQVLREISRLNGSLEQEIYMKQLAGEFSISLDSLKEQLELFEKQQRQEAKSTQEESGLEKGDAHLSTQVRRKRLRPAYENAERMLLAHMLKSDDVIRKVLDRIGIEFNIDSHRALATYIYALYEEGKEPTPQHLMNRIEDDVINQLLTDIFMIQVGDELSEAELSDYVKKC